MPQFRSAKEAEESSATLLMHLKAIRVQFQSLITFLEEVDCSLKAQDQVPSADRVEPWDFVSLASEIRYLAARMADPIMSIRSKLGNFSQQ